MLLPRINRRAAWIPDTAMVLAAGYGKRLRPLTDTLPKPLIPVAGVPTLDRILGKLDEAGVSRAVVNAHHLADRIVSHVESRTQKTPEIHIVRESEALETGGVVRNALPELGPDPFFVINGDSVWLDGMSDTLHRFASGWNSETMDVCLLLYPIARVHGYKGMGDYIMDPLGKLERREERRVAPYVYMGVSILHPRVFADSPEGRFSLNEIYDRAEQAGRLHGMMHDGLWYHISTPTDLEMANQRFAKGHVPDVPFF